MTKLFFLVMYSDFDKSRIAYAGLFDSKQEILKRIKILNYNDLVFRKTKYKTLKSLFQCVEIPSHKRHLFSSYALCDHNRKRQIV
jgi:hypothetical protein